MRPVAGKPSEASHLWKPWKVKASSRMVRFSSTMIACLWAMTHLTSRPPLPPQAQRPEKLLRHFRGIPHQRSGAFFREPVGGEVVAVGGVEEALVEEGDDAGVVRRTDQAAGGLDDAGHARHHEGIFETLLEALFVIVLEELLLQGHRRQAGTHDGHRLQHLAGI